MFHIVFSGDENYLKYTAVCITSIVKNTDTSKIFDDFLNAADDSIIGKMDSAGTTDFTESIATNICSQVPTQISAQISAQVPAQVPAQMLSTCTDVSNNPFVQEEYVFHILTDYISENTRNKLSQLATELSSIFPTQIQIHILGNEEFLGQPLWRNNYLAYYRIKINKALPASIDKILYLDGDTLVNCDIRELFAVDIGDTICATVANVCPMVYTLPSRFDNIQHKFSNNTYYFNSGVMLLSLAQWREQDIETKVFQFLRKYITRAPDQDALNAVINQNLVKLPYKWNMMIHKRFLPSETINIDESPNYNNQHTKADFLEGMENPKIIHYAMKPWNGKGFSITATYQPYYFPNFDLWWAMVEKTPVFREELKAIKESVSYKKNVAKGEKEEKMLSSGKFSIALFWFKFKRESRPYIQKLEAPFKKIRNKIRAKKISKA